MNQSRWEPEKYVVAWDPKNEYWEGAIVDKRQAPELSARGAALLPCVPELFTQAAFAGYAKRSWGAGWPLEGAIPRATCPLAIFYPGEPHRRIWWRARLVGTKGQGIPLRLAAAEGRGNLMRPVIHEVGGKGNAVDVAQLEAPDENDGWTVGGTATLSVGGPSMIPVCLYGCAPGMRVAWLAATLTP